MIKPLYFAYGSNMLLSRIEERVGKVIKKGNFILPNYKIAFNCSPGHWPYTNIVESQGSKVEGVLYEINERQISELDRYEGYPFIYEKFYLIDNNRLIFGYHCVNPRHLVYKGQPLHAYLDLCIQGAKENNLIETVSSLLEYEKINYKKKSKLRKLVR